MLTPTNQIYDRMGNCLQNSPNPLYIPFTSLNPEEVNSDNIETFAHFGELVVTNLFGKHKGLKTFSLEINTPVEDAYGDVHKSLHITVDSKGKSRCKYGPIEPAWQLRKDVAVFLRAPDEAIDFIARVDQAYQEIAGRELSPSNIASILHLLAGTLDERGTANYWCAVKHLTGVGLSSKPIQAMQKAFSQSQSTAKSKGA